MLTENLISHFGSNLRWTITREGWNKHAKPWSQGWALSQRILIRLYILNHANSALFSVFRTGNEWNVLCLHFDLSLSTDPYKYSPVHLLPLLYFIVVAYKTISVILTRSLLDWHIMRVCSKIKDIKLSLRLRIAVGGWQLLEEHINPLKTLVYRDPFHSLYNGFPLMSPPEQIII